MAVYFSPQKKGLWLGSPRTATKAFGTTTNYPFTAIPRIKFLFFVEFSPSPAALEMMLQANLNTYQGNRGIVFKIKTVDKPKITLTTKDLNQYNKKRLVYTGVDYGEAQIKLHNSVDDAVLSMWVDYFTYFFGDSRIHNSQSYQQSPVAAQFADSTGWGLRPLSEQTQFFDKISIYCFFGQTYTKFSYINPKITVIDWQNNDYSSSDPEEVSISFKYEAIQYEKFGEPITQAQAEQFNLGDGFANVQNKLKVQSPRILTNQASNQITGQQANQTPPTLPSTNILSQTAQSFLSAAQTLLNGGLSVLQGTTGRNPVFVPNTTTQNIITTSYRSSTTTIFRQGVPVQTTFTTSGSIPVGGELTQEDIDFLNGLRD